MIPCRVRIVSEYRVTTGCRIWVPMFCRWCHRLFVWDLLEVKWCPQFPCDSADVRSCVKKALLFHRSLVRLHETVQNGSRAGFWSFCADMQMRTDKDIAKAEGNTSCKTYKPLVTLVSSKISGNLSREREDIVCSNQGSEAPYVFRHFDELIFLLIDMCSCCGLDLDISWILIILCHILSPLDFERVRVSAEARQASCGTAWIIWRRSTERNGRSEITQTGSEPTIVCSTFRRYKTSQDVLFLSSTWVLAHRTSCLGDSSVFCPSCLCRPPCWWFGSCS